MKTKNTENCWEYMRCGKEKSCPAYPGNGINCWEVAGTYCDGIAAGFFATTKHICSECPWYKEIMRKKRGK